MINLFQFAVNAKAKLNNAEISQYASLFVQLKSECYHTYQNGLIQSGTHGIDFFSNIIKYWEQPDSYPLPKEKIGRIYEENFITLLKQNKNA